MVLTPLPAVLQFHLGRGSQNPSSWTGSICITWNGQEIVRVHILLSGPPQAYWIRNSRAGPRDAISLARLPGASDTHSFVNRWRMQKNQQPFHSSPRELWRQQLTRKFSSEYFIFNLVVVICFLYPFYLKEIKLRAGLRDSVWILNCCTLLLLFSFVFSLKESENKRVEIKGPNSASWHPVCLWKGLWL